MAKSPMPPLRGWKIFFLPCYPWLAPWATRYRPLRGLPVAARAEGTPRVQRKIMGNDQPEGRGLES
jgi:hypothetical protein